MSIANHPKSETGRSGKNLAFTFLDKLDWRADQRAASLDKLYEYVRKDAADVVQWYLDKKDRKKRCAVVLRLTTIVLATLGALAPLLSDTGLFGMPVPGILSSVCLILAGALVAMDYFFGCSTSWMRFVDTGLKIRNRLEDFQLEWESQRSGFKDNTPDDEQIQAMLESCRTFQTDVNVLLTNEMKAWMEEFRNALARIDRSLPKEQLSGKGGTGGQVTAGAKAGGTSQP